MAVGIVIAVALAAVFVWSLLDAPRNPSRWGWFFDRGNIARTRAWVVALTTAALVGAALAGATGAALALIAAVGLVAFGVLGRVQA